MLKSLKRVLIVLFLLTVVFVLGTYIFTKYHTYFNKDTHIGNTSGNIYNGGLFSQVGDSIYFSNDYDRGALYSMNDVCENIKKITDDPAVYINTDKHYVYFIKADSNIENNNNALIRYNNGGVYRIDNNGKGLINYTANPSSYLMLKGNFLYYQQYNVDQGTTMARAKLDQKDERILTHTPAIPFSISNNVLYYYDAAKNDQIMGIDLSSFTTHLKFKGSYKYPIYSGNYIYYINPSKNNNIYRMKKDGTTPELIINESCSTYNITKSGQYLYYQGKTNNGNKIGRINLETMNKEIVLKGDYKNIFITSNYVFLNNSKHTKIYKLLADGGNDISELIPTK